MRVTEFRKVDDRYAWLRFDDAVHIGAVEAQKDFISSRMITFFLCVNSKILSGYGAITGVTTTEKDLYVAFPHTMPAGVKVVVCIYASSYNRRIHVKSISQNGFTVTGALLSGTSSAPIEFNWIAHAN